MYSDACLAFRNHRVVESCNEYPFFRYAGGKFLAERGVIQHYGKYGTLRGLAVETGGEHLLAEITDILLLTVVQFVGFG